jgi:fatty acid synthase, animal type
MNCEKSSIAICGISGRFPQSRNLNEFAKNLYEKVDMIDDEESRWKHIHPLLTKRFGKVSGLEKFDASFFYYMDKHANITDPQIRMLLEHCYEAIIDAGVNPQALFGKRIGVFVACMMLDSKDSFMNSVPMKHGDGGTFVTYVLGLIFYETIATYRLG